MRENKSLVSGPAHSNGHTHEDGLADVGDAFFVAKEPEERLKIMKDSRIGTYGTVALLFSILLRIELISSILVNLGLYAAFIALMVSEAVSRGGMVWFWTRLPLARKNGTQQLPENLPLLHYVKH